MFSRTHIARANETYRFPDNPTLLCNGLHCDIANVTQGIRDCAQLFVDESTCELVVNGVSAIPSKSPRAGVRLFHM
jgi:hypothetical protein